MTTREPGPIYMSRSSSDVQEIIRADGRMRCFRRWVARQGSTSARLHDAGVLARNGVEVIGASIEASERPRTGASSSGLPRDRARHAKSAVVKDIALRGRFWRMRGSRSSSGRVLRWRSGRQHRLCDEEYDA